MSSADLVAAAPAPPVSDTETGLRRLIDRGFQFVHPRSPEGEVLAVVGIRAHENVIDVVRLHAEDDVIATRMPGGEPDILAPRTTLWQVSGSVLTVIDQLLALPDQPAEVAVAAETGGQGGRGCWVPGRGGAAKWLPASA
ncbi:hypothetical protein [Amycolatopsis sp. YIM 10]|uniref:hypothetical protein n=1 Tax=Amycolatopsis sp. YIM 10 TaxID=2653857 RepID=UPI0012A92CF3|nr:hypothetical protein [Amycolatopsis sp. YIM 10]QFU94415.1 hypothetical protein YIM_46445 [Amycolatopsis sp. YIM 10]